MILLKVQVHAITSITTIATKLCMFSVIKLGFFSAGIDGEMLFVILTGAKFLTKKGQSIALASAI